VIGKTTVKRTGKVVPGDFILFFWKKQVKKKEYRPKI